MKQHHCLQCGTPMERREIESRIREVCPACGWIFYQNLKVGAGVVVEDEGRLLLLRRASDPWRGDWNVPAGFVEVDEQPAQAAVREVFEECGLQVAITRQLGAYWYGDDPRGSGISIFFAGEITGGEINNSDEVDEYAFFGRSEIPANLAKGGHDQVIIDWRQGKFSSKDRQDG